MNYSTRDRKKEYVDARAFLSYCLNDYLGISGKEIGDLLRISRQASMYLIKKGERDKDKYGNVILLFTSVP